uniref:guanylate kinase n=1 Tax=Compsopogon caeruleus TaxID=31354 RepID=A0A7S1TBH5_9RHOD|mmetsp:Transcript_16283/g.33040  ORF Transcript_16283/g.33040 Transcript_16283/m.33040 type:complete len:529 (+) Transcript_16283:1457-3043(+)
MALLSGFLVGGGLVRKWTKVDSRCQCGLTSRRPLLRVTSCVKSAETEIDARGFVIPKVGQVVVFAGRWPGEDAVGLVEGVQLVQSKTYHVADVVTMRGVGPSLYAVDRKVRGARQWMDVGRLRVASDAEFVASQNAYRVQNLRDGYAVVPVDPSARERYWAEYERLKWDLVRSALFCGAGGTVVDFAVTRSGGDALCFALGSAFGIAYLLLLERDVDTVRLGVQSWLTKLRFLLPAVPLGVLAALAPILPFTLVKEGPGLLPVSLRNDVVLSVVLGFLSFKLPILWKGAHEALSSLEDMDTGEPTNLGSAFVSALVGLSKRRDREESTFSAPSNDDGTPRRPVVICGPSGVGKSTLIRKLHQRLPNRFGFSVSHTTRSPRPGEVHGRDYLFISAEEFRAMVDRGEFIEWAEVHGNLYGTSWASIQRVSEAGLNCLLDIDIQGVEAITASPTLDPITIWVAPPSMETLTKRLQSRGTESEESIHIRLQQASREMEFAATRNLFDFTVVNDDILRAVEELSQYLSACLDP